ncbi:hypothetical protein B296_00003463 [Ensete ventricosum]|uniref:Uncharacterized protein n=1 Tax=Ensete ventricosum TaxID=4639 RepID=A0A427ASK2_ENSVE|nr:hypothetical protein B296_00003463 [Ensete ventricosum]
MPMRIRRPRHPCRMLSGPRPKGWCHPCRSSSAQEECIPRLIEYTPITISLGCGSNSKEENLTRDEAVSRHGSTASSCDCNSMTHPFRKGGWQRAQEFDPGDQDREGANGIAEQRLFCCDDWEQQ